jgi:hypothetical protein
VHICNATRTTRRAGDQFANEKHDAEIERTSGDLNPISNAALR